MHETTHLQDILILLSAAVLIVAVFRHLNLSPVLGYLVAGAAIGPYGLGLIGNIEEEAGIFAEFGIVFLLFAIGLELTFERLMAMRRHVFGFGTAQVLLTGLLLFAVAHYTLGLSVEASIVVGGGLALSSTAIVLQVLADSSRQATQVGRLSLAILLLQDFAVVPLLVLVPLLASSGDQIGMAITSSLIKAGIALIAIFLLGRMFLRPAFRMVGMLKSDELFIAVTLLVVLGTSFATHHAGLSLALGAFMAGLLVAETEYQQQVEADIIPFKGLLLGLFFMTVGMRIDIMTIIEELPTILLYSILLITLKSSVIGALCKLFGFAWGSSVHAGLLLSQGGEFAFILFGLAITQNILPQDIGQTLLLVVAVTMALTPLLSVIGAWFGARLDNRDAGEKQTTMEAMDLDKHVIIVGFGRVGKTVARLLAAEHVNYVILDIDYQKVKAGRKEGFPVHLGDPSRLRSLASIGIDRARAVVLTVRNEITLKKATNFISSAFPEIPIIVRSEDLERASSQVYKDTIIIPETFETGLQLGTAALKSLGIADHEIIRVKERFRAGNYALAKIGVVPTDEESTSH